MFPHGFVHEAKGCALGFLGMLVVLTVILMLGIGIVTAIMFQALAR